jgi:hypothetical protein
MNAKRAKFRIAYFIIVSLGIVGFLIYFILDISHDHDRLILNEDIPSEYLSILKIKDTSELKPLISYNTKYRFPITLMDYKTKYTLIIYKVCDSLAVPITKFVHIKYNYSLGRSFGIYTVVNENIFELNFLDDTIKKCFQIEMNLSGDSISNLMQSDTLISYYLKFDQISWTKNSNNFLDIYIEPKDITPFAKKIPASIAFLKRNNSLFFILLTVNGYNTSFETKFLLNLLLPYPQVEMAKKNG